MANSKLPIVGQPVFAGRYTMPVDHEPVVFVPRIRGARCTSCKWLAENEVDCLSGNYIRFMGTTRLPGPAHLICSDWWEPRG